MKITITATNKLTEIAGVPVRLWEGKTESGIPCKVFVVHISQDSAQFDAELKELMPPPVKVDLRHIL